MIVTNKINAYLHQNQEYHMDAVQGDTARVLELALYAGSEAWQIPAGAMAQLRFRKPDGTGGVYDALPDGTVAATIRGNAVTMTLAPQVLTASGTVEAQVLLCWDGAELASFTINIHVQADPSRGTTESMDYVNLSQRVTTAVQTYLEKEQDRLRDIFAEPGAFFAEATATDHGYTMNKTYEQLRCAFCETENLEDGGQAVFCILHRSEGRDVLLRLACYDTAQQKLEFAALDGGDCVRLSLAADETVEYSLTPMAKYADVQPVIVTFDWDGAFANRELAELYAAYQAGKRVCFLWDGVLLPTVMAGEAQWRFSTVAEGKELWVTLGLNEDGYTIITDQDSRTLLSSLPVLTIDGKTYNGTEAVTVTIPKTPGNAIVGVALEESLSDDTKNVLALTNYDDGGNYLELPRGTPPLYVKVDIRSDTYTADKTVKELYAAYRNGRTILCHLLTSTGERFFNVYNTYGAENINVAWGLMFGGVWNGTEWSISVGTSGISVHKNNLVYTKNLPATLPNPQSLTINGQTYDGSQAVELTLSKPKQWHLVEKRTLDGTVGVVDFSGLELSDMRAFFTVPQGSANISVGVEAYIDKTLVGYAWLATLVSSSSDRVAMVDANIDGGLVVFGNTVPANAAVNARTYCKNPNFVAATGAFTKLGIYAESASPFPSGTVIELWGKDA